MGCEKTCDINNFLNKKYCGVPFEDNYPFTFLEAFDTENFFGSDVDDEVILQVNDIADGKVSVIFVINHEYLKASFDGFLHISETDMVYSISYKA